MGKEYEEKMLKMQKALISLSLDSKLESASMMEKVRFLKNLDFDYKEVAQILRTSPKSISVMFSKINKEK